MLARALQIKKAGSTIHTIKDSSGRSFVTSDGIADQFINYFTKLYNLPTQKRTEKANDRKQTIDSFLTQYSSTPLTIEDSAALDHPISMEETIEALKQLKMSKSPGPDGLTVSYYKSFADILLPKFITAFNSLASTPQACKDILEAHITLLPKPDKDPTLVSNNRPISLLNVDMKLYAKVLSNRILPLLPKLVSLDEVGFVKGQEARDNTIKALNIHHWLSNSSRPIFLLSLDAEKAFDRVAWEYMKATLQAMGVSRLPTSTDP